MCALIPAAGRGARFGAPQNKVFAPLLGRPLLGWTLQAFADCPDVDSVVLIGSEADLPVLREIGERYGGGKVRDVVLGGADRQSSVRNGLAACPDAEFIVIHDAARPCVTPALIAQVLSSAHDVGSAATAVVPVADTLVRGPLADSGQWYPRVEGGIVAHSDGETVPRDGVFAVQTPQAFKAEYIRLAHAEAEREGFVATDDCGLIRWYREFIAGQSANQPSIPDDLPPSRLHDLIGQSGHGGWYYLRLGSPENLKVTRPEDLALAEAILARRHAITTGSPLPSSGEGQGVGTDFRIGHGYDVHPFADASENRTLFLGGVAFPESPRGMKAHSDGDVLLHALCDALLGAAGLGDIGKLFPPSDARHKDRPSIEFLREVAARLRADGWRVGNVDVTVLAEAPKIGPRADDMKRLISVELGISPPQVGIKATTNEGLGFIGRGEGIAVHATALLVRP